jgi:hypothetical protein
VTAERPATLSGEDIRAAATVIRRAIAEADGPLPPPFLIEFLMRDWRRYLAIVHHEAGTKSIIWKAAEGVTERLLVSVLPHETQAVRQSFIKGLPQLITDVKAGVALAGLEAEARERFLSELRACHLGLLEAPLQVPAAAPLDMRETLAMSALDPRYREFLEKLDGLDGIEHIEM